ncbi:MAG: endonuclease/exonuclease/phosphatase family protein [Bacteroidales bacterium]|nr:endonuclease/exonuclease/phosphatase family protein [Bacteroidales bacterium]
MKYVQKFFMIAAVLLCAITLTGRTAWHSRSRGTVRIATYNVGIFDKYPKSGYRLTSRLVKEIDPDVIVLNELDSCTFRTGMAHQLKKFVKRMGVQWEGRFAPALKPFQTGAYGIGEAWNTRRMKALRSFNVALPKGEGTEPRALVVVEYDDMVVAGTHLEHTKASAREIQVNVISDTLKSLYGESGKPVFLCGDMNASPGSETLRLLGKDWTVLSAQKTTYPRKSELENLEVMPETADETPGSCIDYILILNNGAGYELVASDVCVNFRSGSAFTASDHLPVYVDVILK